MSYRQISVEYFDYVAEIIDPQPILVFRLDDESDAEIYHFYTIRTHGIKRFYLRVDDLIFRANSVAEFKRCLLNEFGIERTIRIPKVEGFDYSLHKKFANGGESTLFPSTFRPMDTFLFAATSIVNPQ